VPDPTIVPHVSGKGGRFPRLFDIKQQFLKVNFDGVNQTKLSSQA
jgi:hypothetical protein